MIAILFALHKRSRITAQRREQSGERMTSDGSASPVRKANEELIEENESLRAENRNMFILLEVRACTAV